MPGQSVALLFFSATLHKHPLEELANAGGGAALIPNLLRFLIIITFSLLTQKGFFFTWWFPKKTHPKFTKNRPSREDDSTSPQGWPVQGDGGRELLCFP